MSRKEDIQKELAGAEPLHFVYVDDETALLEVIQLLIAGLGFKPFVTASAAEALQFIGKNKDKIAFVLSDFKMPETNGLEFRAKVLEIAPALPFAILSGYVDRDMALKGIDLKISAFLDKPMDLEQFHDLLLKEAVPRIRSIREDLELLTGFLDEADGLVARAEELMLALEDYPDDQETVNSLFGIVHTLKGASSFFEPKTLHRFAHRFEDTLKKVQCGETRVNPPLISGMLKALDLIRTLLGEFRSGEHTEHDIPSLIDRFLSVKKSEVQAVLPARAAQVKQEVLSEVKVEIELLDEFMQMSGEMTVIRNMLNKCVRSIEKQFPGDKEVSLLADLLDELHKINGGLQSKVSELRKVPIRNSLKPLTRGVRDIAMALKKEIRLEFEGEDLMIDTSINDVLSKCLLHLVKNSIDHGIEMPEQRKTLNKVPFGTIKVTASATNEDVVLEIRDDGRGLNPQTLKDKALQNKLFSQSELEAMKPQEIHALIFEAGFSTAVEVTDISGRGVGMSMVKSTVEDIGGSIQIDSTLGQGAKFTLRLPIPKSVLITNCLFVSVGSERYGIPEENVLRVIEVNPGNRSELIQELEGSQVALVNGEVIPIRPLKGMLKDEVSAGAGETCFLVLLRSPAHQRKLALQVDSIIDIEDTVIKGIIPQVNHASLYRGATFLDDGTIGLILQTEGMFDMAKMSRGRKREEAVVATPLVLTTTVSSVLIELSLPGLYAVPQSSIFRIEEIRPELITRSGDLWVVPYRGQTLPLFEPNREWLETQIKGTTSIQTLVLSEGARLIGLVVKNVLDIIETEAPIVDLADRNQMIAGHLMYGEKTVSLVDVAALVDRRFSRRLQAA